MQPFALGAAFAVGTRRSALLWIWPLDSLLAMEYPLPEPSRWGQFIDDPSLPVTNTSGFLWQWQTDPATGQKQWFAIRRVPEADPPTQVSGMMGQTAKAGGTAPMHCYAFLCVHGQHVLAL